MQTHPYIPGCQCIYNVSPSEQSLTYPDIWQMLLKTHKRYLSYVSWGMTEPANEYKAICERLMVAINKWEE